MKKLYRQSPAGKRDFIYRQINRRPVVIGSQPGGQSAAKSRKVRHEPVGKNINILRTAVMTKSPANLNIQPPGGFQTTVQRGEIKSSPLFHQSPANALTHRGNLQRFKRGIILGRA
ncbi:hypothetical protein D8L93_00280 [Sodalis-like symbiont of Bactericera trigonica]|nr:hypothetical protein D8L93_00280 [Sodalis-like symbiont of Bactericera trigonica]